LPAKLKLWKTLLHNFVLQPLHNNRFMWVCDFRFQRMFLFIKPQFPVLWNRFHASNSPLRMIYLTLHPLSFGALFNLIAAHNQSSWLDCRANKLFINSVAMPVAGRLWVDSQGEVSYLWHYVRTCSEARFASYLMFAVGKNGRSTKQLLTSI
jgi:hypothetical protein